MAASTNFPRDRRLSRSKNYPGLLFALSLGRGLPMELILIIVVLVLLFGGGGGILGSQSSLLVTGHFGQSCVCHTDSVHLVSL